MADGGDNAGPSGPFLVTEGEWAGWRQWVGGDPYETSPAPSISARTRCGHGLRLSGRDQAHERRRLHARRLHADLRGLFPVRHRARGLQGGHAVTVSLNGEFVGPANVGDLVEATGEVVRAGGSLVFLRGLISTGGTPMMTFSGW